MPGLLTYHDDWLLTVYLDGWGCYTFVTEMWPEHGTDFDPASKDSSTNWPLATRTAIARAEDLLHRGNRGYVHRLQPLRIDTVEQLRIAVNDALMSMTDEEFRANLL